MTTRDDRATTDAGDDLSYRAGSVLDPKRCGLPYCGLPIDGESFVVMT